MAEKEENNLEHDDDSLQKEVTNFPTPESNDPTPESNNPIPMSSNRSLNIPLKNTLIFQNEHMAYYNPSSLVELFGLRVEISKPLIHSRVASK